jgi:hypothetical protein
MQQTAFFSRLQRKFTLKESWGVQQQQQPNKEGLRKCPHVLNALDYKVGCTEVGLVLGRYQKQIFLTCIQLAGKPQKFFLQAAAPGSTF